MRFLIDNALSPLVAERLRTAGHDATHVRDYNLQDAPDTLVIEQAAREQRVLVSADTDFGTLLALREQNHPSFVLFRHAVRRPREQAELLLANLPAIEDPLRTGSIVVIERTRLRIRSLPIDMG